MKRWGLNRADAEALSEIRLEAGYSRHSQGALTKLCEIMRDGKPYSTARTITYPQQSHASGKPQRLLPPVIKARPDLRNPAVCRTLTELRKVVNAIIRQYGKPWKIRIELARDLKRSRKDRKRIADNQREQESRRKGALGKMLKEFPGYQPKAGFDPAIEKILLAEECNWECPFTGRTIQMATLVGRNSQFDVAHLFPRRFLDDSFLNKTLCYHEENRHRMHDLLPKQAYGADPERWQAILSRVKAFKSPAARIKLERFQAEEVPEDFVSSQLNDTRFITTVAQEYLGILYGGLYDSEGTRRIEAVTGGITALLRNAWNLRKDRSDHRHHAQDAIVLALISPGQVSRLQQAAEIASKRGERLRLGELDEPWTGFRDQVSDALAAINVSFRCNRKLQGSLHAATNYSREIAAAPGKPEIHVRKALHKLSATEISGDAIVDPTIRALVKAKFFELGGKDPKKAFADPKSHPALATKDGRSISVHKVRLRVGDKPKPVGQGVHQRFVTSGANSNHHCVIVAVLNEMGKEIRWEDHVVSRLDANSRNSHDARNNGAEIIQHQWGNGRRFKFSLIPDDFIRMLDDQGVEQLYRVISVSQGDIELRLHSDGRDSTTLKEQKARIRLRSGDKFRQLRAYKVSISPLGDWTHARD
jgi:CRISPR-associated endonuclease Csn1